MFETEWETYQANKAKLVAEADGQFVVIRGTDVLGTYPTVAQAFEAGIEAYGPERFFLHQIAQVEPETYIPTFMSMASAESPIKYNLP